MPGFVCVTCGSQFAESAEPPPRCPICEDERQYVGRDGQRWTTLDELRSDHRAEIREEGPGLVGIGCEPSFAIGQRALLEEVRREVRELIEYLEGIRRERSPRS